MYFLLPWYWSVITLIALVPNKPASLKLHDVAMVLLTDQNLSFVSVSATVTDRTSPQVSLQ